MCSPSLSFHQSDRDGVRGCYLTWLYKSQCCSLEGWQGCRLICSSKAFVSLQGRKRSFHLCRLWNRSSPLSPASSRRVCCAGFFILCSRLTSHSFQMPHVSHSHKSHRDWLWNWLRQRWSRSTEQLDLPSPFSECTDHPHSSERFFGQGGPVSCGVACEHFVRMPESFGWMYWTEAIPEIVHIHSRDGHHFVGIKLLVLIHCAPFRTNATIIINFLPVFQDRQYSNEAVYLPNWN